MLDTSLDPTKKEERMKLTKEAMRKYKEKYAEFELDKAYQSMFNLLWYSQLPCQDVAGISSSVKDESSFIKRCYWKKAQISCNAIFQKRPTDRGMCCSFNMQRAEKTFRESRYSNAIATRQRFDSENGFETSQKPNWFVNNREPISQSGIENGLTLVFDKHSNRLSPGSVTDSFLGVPVLVDGKDKFPLVRRLGIIARPGFKNSIAINALDIKGLDEIRKHSPSKRKCYFPDEFKLDMHKNYSRPSCIFECELKFAAKCLSTCKEINETCDCRDEKAIMQLDLKSVESCIPWFYPIQDAEMQKMCDPWTTMKFRQIFEKKIPRGLCDFCLEDCSSTTYRTSISYSELEKCDNSNIGSVFCDLTSADMNPAPWISDVETEYLAANESIPWFLEFKNKQTRVGITRFPDKRYFKNNNTENVIYTEKLKKNPYYNAFEKDIGFINIFFAGEEVTRYERANKGSPFDLMTQIGGSLGGFMGISVLSLIEILYWVLFRFLGKLL